MYSVENWRRLQVLNVKLIVCFTVVNTKFQFNRFTPIIIYTTVRYTLLTISSTTVSTKLEKNVPSGLLNLSLANLDPRLSILLKTYPLPSLLGTPPSDIANVN